MSKIAPIIYSSQILLFLFFFISTMPFLVISQSPPSELKILLIIKKQWGDQPPMQSWDATTSPCGWPGIQCAGGRDGTITGLSLGNRNIVGEIPPSICDLKNLTTLDLGNNYLRGEFPKVLYNCTKLQKLSLSSNLFVGRLPNDINNLSPNLQHLDLSGNNFTCDIPSSIGKLKGLITLSLQWNLFNGTFPSELGNLGNLEELFLANNAFLPMKLPIEFGKLKSIKFFWMTQCNLIGEIPQSFGNLYNLEQLDLVGNSLEGGIPNGLFLLKNLKFLYLYNNRLSGEIPPSIEARNLVEIDLSFNSLTGNIPLGVANLRKLELLSLFNNQFHGSLPPNISLIPTLKRIKIWNNSFSGPFPPELGLHSRLEVFDVADNEFTGQLPQYLCSGGALWGVAAFNNRLNGSIPNSLAQCNSSRAFQLYNNSFSGEVPKGLWTLQNLSVLKLSNNRFSGQLPGRLAWSITRVEINNNRFSGEIPQSVRYWQNLMVFEASNNLFSGTIPLELTMLSRLSSLSLDGNHLSGELPLRIISWVKLNNLNLSRNELSGSIPAALGSLPGLNYLDLSENQFSGEIPSGLGHLRLSKFNLSSNKLTGGIPSGLDDVAYENSFLNTSLCSESGRVLGLPRCSINTKNAHKLPYKDLALIIVFALLAFLVIIYFSWVIIFKLPKRKHTQDMLSSWKMTSFQRLDFTEEKILTNLTETNLIGSGGSGKVYRILVNGSGEKVAVKRIWNEKLSKEKEFLAEVQVLGNIRHLNIVKLLCCISSENSKILVYEYMENQSLDKWIHEGKPRPVSLINGSDHPVVLDWPARSRVALGAAQGLSYMHHDCSPPIIHRDVKSSNVLLDSEFNAKIADFGLARVLDKPGGEPYTVSAVAGSFGYMAPEYCYSTKVTEKIDVYSFGVVLLELVTGKEPHIGDEYSNLAEWAWRHFNEGHPIVDALDEVVKEDGYLEDMTNVFMLGLMCTNTLASSRPTMKEVWQVLKRCTSLEGSGTAKDRNYDRDFTPLLGSGRYVSSCRNSRNSMEEDYYDMV